MTSPAGNPYQCAGGHRQYLPYRMDAVQSWCEECRAMSEHKIIRPPAGTSPEQSADIHRAIADKFRSLAATWDESGRGNTVHLTPDPKTAKEAAIMAALGSAGFPGRHIATLPTMDREGKADARRVVEALNGPGPAAVVLWGDYGTGKTQVATAAAMLRHEKQQRTRYVSAQSLTRAIRDNFHTKIPEADLLRKFTESPGLVIDEIQAALDESPDKTSWARTQIQGILDARYSSSKPLKTILICNADSIAALNTRMGAHIISRVNECGQFFQVSRRNYRTIKKAREPYAA